MMVRMTMMMTMVSMMMMSTLVRVDASGPNEDETLLRASLRVGIPHNVEVLYVESAGG